MHTLRDSKDGGSKTQKSGVEKKFQKLRRMDLLELLLDQIRENEKLGASAEELSDLGERLKKKLDDKDAQIERLRTRLDDKDSQIERLKTRLDDKDSQIERLRTKLDDKDGKIRSLEKRNRRNARLSGMIDIKELLEVEERAVESYLNLAAERQEQRGRKLEREKSSHAKHVRVSGNSASDADARVVEAEGKVHEQDGLGAQSNRDTAKKRCN